MNIKNFTVARRRVKREPVYITYLFIIWAVFLIIAVALTIRMTKTVKHRYYNEQIEAAHLAQTAMEKIKERKKELGIPFPNVDIYECGMIGDWTSQITTTSGIIGAKRTAVNPDFAAVYIDMFKEADVNKGDQIALIMSGSFPTLNISAMAAAQVLDLDVCIMSSIGSSTFGANHEDFTFFDMAEYLYSIGIFTNRIDYVSFGGSNDDGAEYPSDVRNNILERINKSGIPFLCESNLEKNVKQRTQLIFDKCPNVKLLVSVGGTLVAMGEGDTGTSLYRGLVKPAYLNIAKDIDESQCGLLDVFLNKGIPVIQMLNVKGIALDYGIEYDPVVIPEIGSSDAYIETSYNLFIPITALVITSGLLIFYYVYRKKQNKNWS